MPVNVTRRGLLGTALLVGSGGTLLGQTSSVRAGKSPPRRSRPLVLGHRGSCAHRPEHTLASYARAIADGADFIEPDLVATKDGVLVARHENNIAETTDVSARPEFAARRTTRIIDGETITGWFTEDFTLAELKKLRAKERLGALRPESHSFDGQFPIPTFAEIVALAAAETRRRGRRVGLIPELKHPTYFAALGLALEPRILAMLRSNSYLSRAPVIVQCFEIAPLRRLRASLAGRRNVRLMQLTEGTAVPADRAAAGDKRTWSARLAPAGLAEIATYADFLAPWSRDLMPLAPDGSLGADSGLIAAAHRAGLKVGTYTFRPENRFLPADLRSTAGENARNPVGSIAEMRRYISAGIDALFTDDPALGRIAADGGDFA
jgi:glycerophosphoryl diester phosphodiesterase